MPRHITGYFTSCKACLMLSRPWMNKSMFKLETDAINIPWIRPGVFVIHRDVQNRNYDIFPSVAGTTFCARLPLKITRWERLVVVVVVVVGGGMILYADIRKQVILKPVLYTIETQRRCDHHYQGTQVRHKPGVHQCNYSSHPIPDLDINNTNVACPNRRCSCFHLLITCQYYVH